MERIERNRWSGIAVSVLCAGVVALEAAPAGALPIATAEFTGGMRPRENMMGVSGPGAVAAHARAGGDAKAKGATLAPAEKDGDNYSDQTKLGVAPKEERAIKDPMGVIKIGQSLRNVYPLVGTNPSDAARQEIFYDIQKSDDKIADAKAAQNNQLLLATGGLLAHAVPNNLNSTFAFASATQRVNADGSAEGFVRAVAQQEKPGGRVPAWAISLINDPTEFALEDSQSTGVVDLFIGRDFMLQAATERSFATALFEFGARMGDDPDDETLLMSFFVEIDFQTQDLADVLIKVLNFDADVFPSPGSFEESFRELLVFDLPTHTLSVREDLEEIILFQVFLEAGSDPVTVRFDYGGIAGIAPAPVPEPTLAATAALAAAALASLRRRHDRGPSRDARATLARPA